MLINLGSFKICYLAILGMQRIEPWPSGQEASMQSSALCRPTPFSSLCPFQIERSPGGGPEAIGRKVGRSFGEEVEGSREIGRVEKR